MRNAKNYDNISEKVQGRENRHESIKNHEKQGT